MKCPGTEEALDKVLLQVFAALPCSERLQAVAPCGLCLLGLIWVFAGALL